MLYGEFSEILFYFLPTLTDYVVDVLCNVPHLSLLPKHKVSKLPLQLSS